MTVIASFMAGNVPCLVSDLLVSSPEHLPSLEIPSLLGNIRGHYAKGIDDFVRLERKLVVLGPRCALAWAGSRLQADSVVKRASELYRSGELSQATLEEAAREHGASLDSLKIVGWLVADDGSTLNFGYGVEPMEPPPSHMPASLPIQIEGSAAAAVEHALFHANLEFRPRFDVSPLHKAKLTCAQLIGALYCDEMFKTGRSHLSQMAGGGFEAAFIVNGEVQLLDDITFIVWETRGWRGGPDRPNPTVAVELAEAPILVLKQKYFGRKLVMRRILKMRRHPNDIRIHSTKQFIVERATETQQPFDEIPKTIPMASALYAVIIMVEDIQYRTSRMITVLMPETAYPNGSLMFAVEMPGGECGVTFNPLLQVDIKARAEEMLRSPKALPFTD